MSSARRVVVTGLGVACGLGLDVASVAAALAAGESAVRAAGDHRDLLPVPGFGIANVDVRPLLKRRKDRKLLPRAAELAIVAASGAIGGDRLPGMGLFLGVGREPPDDGETELALVHSMRDGQLDPELLNTVGRAAYPPLASLRTLPNLVLAHVAIQLDCTGPGGTRAGGAAAGLAAVIEGVYAIAEGRADVVLAGAADSGVNAGSARDLVRLGWCGPHAAPGEGAALLRLESAEGAAARGARVLAEVTHVASRTTVSPGNEAAHAQLGWLGAAAGVLDLVLGMAEKPVGTVGRADSTGSDCLVGWRSPVS